MAGSQIATSVTILNSLLGYQGISLTNFSTSTLSAIAAGSKIEIASAFFNFSGDETINASSWTAITTATTAYIALTPSGTAGSQIVEASYTADAPVWSTSKQGYYVSAGSSIRIIGSVYKDSDTQQSKKIILEKTMHGCEVFLSSGTFLVPANVNTIYISGCAAGGNGGTAANTGGGGGGEWALKKSFSVVAGSSLTVVIGAVSANTSIGSFSLNCGVTTTTSAGGAGGALSMGTGAGGAGGASGHIGYPGLQTGGAALRVTYDYGGGGGSYGAGGNAGNVAPIGIIAGYGGGGGSTGGIGGPAILIIEW